MSRLDAGLKRRFGYLLYIVECLKVLATHSFPLFRATFYGNGAGKPRAEEVSQLLAVRIADFGGMVRKLAPGATLRKETLSLVAFRTRNRLHFMLFMLAVVFRRQTFARQIELVDAVSVECDARSGSQENVFVEADGELLGTLPVRIEIVPGALTFLIPKAIESR
jgi:diacylglycerol kinase family enzyme